MTPEQSYPNGHLTTSLTQLLTRAESLKKQESQTETEYQTAEDASGVTVTVHCAK